MDAISRFFHHLDTRIIAANLSELGTNTTKNTLVILCTQETNKKIE